MQFSDDALGLFLRQTTGNTVWKSVSDQGRLACATYSVACCAVLQALGPDWCQTHIGRTDKASDYFKANKSDHHELLRHLSRVTEFGELIYNLHGVPGFDERIRLIGADKGGVESGIAELIAGKFFKMADVIFQYVTVEAKPGEEKPKNPDIEYAAGSNRLESCEVKCNLLSTELNETSIVNALKNAKKQLPKGKAGIILLRVPETWLVDMEAGTTVIGKAINDFIKNEKTTRVSSIFAFASETRFLPNDKMARTFLAKEVKNDFCQLHSGISARSIMFGGDGRWRTLEDLVKRELRVA